MKIFVDGEGFESVEVFERIKLLKYWKWGEMKKKIKWSLNNLGF